MGFNVSFFVPKLQIFVDLNFFVTRLMIPSLEISDISVDSFQEVELLIC